MSRLIDKIDKAKSALYAAQNRLEELEDKQRQYNQKRYRKAHRRKFASNAIYRLMVKNERTMFEACALNSKAGQIVDTFLGINAQIKAGLK